MVYAILNSPLYLQIKLRGSFLAMLSISVASTRLCVKAMLCFPPVANVSSLSLKTDAKCGNEKKYTILNVMNHSFVVDTK